MEDQFQLLFEKMKIEMKNQTSELTESITNTIIQRMDEKLEPIIAENKNMKLKIDNLEKEIEYLKREKKSNNIIIFGLKEEENTTPELLQNVKENFKSDLNIIIEDHEVNKIHRIGNLNKEGNRPRPTLLSLVNGWKKTEIILNKKKLRNIYVTEDYSKEVLERRKALQPKLTEERNKGNIAYLKYDKLIIKENNNNKDKRKRESSASPQTNCQPRKQQTFTSSKVNRTNAYDMMRARSNSLSTP